MPRGFELANFLMEYKGLSDKVISNKTKKEIISNYLGKNKVSDNDIFIIDIYSLISHYYWGCWGLMQHNLSQIDFDYYNYGINRFNLFLKYYEIIISNII